MLHPVHRLTNHINTVPTGASRPINDTQTANPAAERARVTNQDRRTRAERSGVSGDVDASRRHVGRDGGRVQEED